MSHNRPEAARRQVNHINVFCGAKPLANFHHEQQFPQAPESSRRICTVKFVIRPWRSRIFLIEPQISSEVGLLSWCRVARGLVTA